MNIDIRESVKANLVNSSSDEICHTINDAISLNDEMTLPGLGVIMEILWKNLDQSKRQDLASIIVKGLL